MKDAHAKDLLNLRRMFCKTTCKECVIVVVAATPLTVLPPSPIASCCCCARADSCGGWHTAVDTTFSGDGLGTVDIVAEVDIEELGREEGKSPLTPAAGTVEELEWPDAAVEEVVAEVVVVAAVGVRD